MEPSTDTTGDEGATGDGGKVSVDDILETLGLEPETDEEKAGAPPVSKADKAAKRAEAEAKVDAKSDEDDESEGETVDGKKKVDAKADAPEKTAEQKEIDDWMATRKRVKEKKAAARAAAAKPAEITAQAAAPAKTDADKSAEGAKGTAAAVKASEVQAAVADIIKALEALDGDDAEADAKKDESLAAKAKKEVDLTTIKEKLGVLATAVEDSAAAKAKFGDVEKELRAKLDEIEAERWVEVQAETMIAKMEDKLPNLSKRRDGARLVYSAAAKFLERKGKTAPLAFIAESVEKVLARRASEREQASQKNGTAGRSNEKQHNGRTVSRDLSTPPSRRQTDDKRTPAQVEEDLRNAFPGAFD